MASETDVRAIKDIIESNASDYGFGDSALADRLDQGQSVHRIAAVYFQQRANAVLYLVNTSEAGSSRGNDAIYSRLQAMADKYKAIADAEDAAATPVVDATERIGSIKMKRV